jgi:hypothetical protein
MHTPPRVIRTPASSLATMLSSWPTLPVAEQLATSTGHAVALAVWGNFGPTIIRMIDAREPLHVSVRAGTVMSILGTATGRAFAGVLPVDSIQKAMAVASNDFRPKEARVSPHGDTLPTQRERQDELFATTGSCNELVAAFWRQRWVILRASADFAFSGEPILDIFSMLFAARSIAPVRCLSNLLFARHWMVLAGREFDRAAVDVFARWRGLGILFVATSGGCIRRSAP